LKHGFFGDPEPDAGAPPIKVNFQECKVYSPDKSNPGCARCQLSLLARRTPLQGDMATRYEYLSV
jgi:hypothetical protein